MVPRILFILLWQKRLKKTEKEISNFSCPIQFDCISISHKMFCLGLFEQIKIVSESTGFEFQLYWLCVTNIQYSFSKSFGYMVFPKKLPWNMIFLESLESLYYFLSKIWSYISDGKWKMIFLKKNICKYDIICIFGPFSYKYEITFLQKKQRWPSPRTYT